MKYISLVVLSSLLLTQSNAQVDGEMPVITTQEIKFNTSRLYGKVVDSKTGKGLDAITVQLYAIIRDSARGTSKDSLVGSMFSKPNGDFAFINLPPKDSLRLNISAVGYTNHTETFVLNTSPVVQGGYNKDMGNIMLQQDVQTMAGVTVTAQRPALEMGIDRKIFNVDRALTATGGTAIDVMKNIPSVSVDVEGNVQLRSSTPQIFVDGRPTILTLDQIPADNIERVELITNPSARFDAASTGGIINVILKRNKRVGLNGVATIGAGSPDILTGNVSLNARQGKFNFFVSGSYNQSGGKAKGRSFRQNKNNGVVTDYFNRFSENDRKRRFNSIRFGLDFFADNRNTISFTQNIVDGKFSNEETQRQEYLNVSKELTRLGNRYADNVSNFKRYNTQLNFTHKFPEQGKELSANINYNYGSGGNTSNITNNFFNPDGSVHGNVARIQNIGNNDNDQVTFQVDFVNPQGDDAKFETGVRSYINKQKSLFAAYALENGIATELGLSNNYAFEEMVNAFYATYSNQWKGWRYQAGLRAEHSQFDGELVDSAQKFGYEYPKTFKNLFDALFPSLFITRSINDDKEIQFNYSRRIRRPNFWQLNPFVDINDPVNISRGNPFLQPEFTNSFEANYNQQYQKGNFLGVIYYRNNQGDITRYSDTISKAQYLQLNNAAIDSNAILNTFINTNSTNRLGAEFTLQHKFTPNFDITPTIDLQYRKVNANVGDLNLSNEGFSWEGKLIVNYKIETEKPSLFNNLGFQLIGEYESEEVNPQGRSLEEYSVDFAMRKDLFKEKRGTLTFALNDVFNTNRFGSIYDTETFYQDSYSRRNVRNFRITFSYKFGNADFTIFRRSEGGNNGDDD